MPSARPRLSGINHPSQCSLGEHLRAATCYERNVSLLKNNDGVWTAVKLDPSRDIACTVDNLGTQCDSTGAPSKLEHRPDEGTSRDPRLAILEGPGNRAPTAKPGSGADSNTIAYLRAWPGEPRCCICNLARRRLFSPRNCVGPSLAGLP